MTNKRSRLTPRDPFHEANHRRKAGPMTSGPRELDEYDDIAEQVEDIGLHVLDGVVTLEIEESLGKEAVEKLMKGVKEDE